LRHGRIAASFDERRSHGELVFERIIGSDEFRPFHPFLGSFLNGNKLPAH
jgi:hypothetical protein